MWRSGAEISSSQCGDKGVRPGGRGPDLRHSMLSSFNTQARNAAGATMCLGRTIELKFALTLAHSLKAAALPHNKGDHHPYLNVAHLVRMSFHTSTRTTSWRLLRFGAFKNTCSCSCVNSLSQLTRKRLLNRIRGSNMSLKNIRASFIVA